MHMKVSVISVRSDEYIGKKVWSKTTSGRWGYLNEWAQNPAWPSWYFKNDTAETIEIYLELPSGLALSDFRFEKEKI